MKGHCLPHRVTAHGVKSIRKVKLHEDVVEREIILVTPGHVHQRLGTVLDPNTQLPKLGYLQTISRNTAASHLSSQPP